MSYREEWKEYRLVDITDKIGDGLHGTPKYNNEGEYYFINGSNLIDGKISISEKTKKVDKKQFEKHKKELSEKTIFLSINGTIGNVALYNNEKCILGKSAAYFNISDEFDRNYVKYLFLNNHFQNYIKQNATGTTIKNVGLALLRGYKFFAPKNPITRTRIASILSAFDEKIEVNRQMNATLEAMAQAMFREMCLPDDEEELEEGWEWRKIGDLVKIKHGYAFKGKFFSKEPTNDILLSPGNFKIGGGFSFKKQKYYNGEIPTDYILNKGDLIVTMTDLSKAGDTLGYSALVPKIHGKTLLHNQRLGRIIYKSEKPLRMFLSWLMRSHKYRSLIVGSASGSTVKHTSPTKIQNFKFVLPPDNVLKEFEILATDLWELQHKNFQENQALAKSRDLLLPKLMSGEIEV